MKIRVIWIAVCFFILFSCKKDSLEKNWLKTRKTNSIERYQNYLVNNPQTIHSLEIRDSLRIFWERYAKKQWGQCDWQVNTLILSIDKDGTILFENEEVKKNKLSDKLEYSISNPFNSIHLPFKHEVDIEEIGEVDVSLGVINVISDRGLDNQQYAEIILLLRACYQKMRNECAMHLYEKPLSELSKREKKNIETIVPMRLRLECCAPT
ncbi:MAG: hypothetical protein ACK5L5_10180 [Bacteroidales bacterium]